MLKDTIEYIRLKVMRDGLKGLKKMTKPDVWHDEAVLVDKVQYHLDGKKSAFKIYVRSMTKYRWDVVLVEKNKKEETIYGAAAVTWPDLEDTIKSMWMSAQHLMVADFDGQNVMWTKHDFDAWWEKKEKQMKEDKKCFIYFKSYEVSRKDKEDV